MCKKFNLLLVLAISVLTLQSTALAADPNMIAMYWMDAGEGNTVWDYSGNERNGTINGVVLWSGFGMIGGCLQFNGGIVEISSNIDDVQFGNKDISVTAWIKTDGRDHAFFSKIVNSAGYNYAFGVGTYGGNGTVAVSNKNRVNMTGTSDVDDGEWHHVSFLQDHLPATDEEVWTLFVDNVLESSFQTNISPDNVGKQSKSGPESTILSNCCSGSC